MTARARASRPPAQGPAAHPRARAGLRFAALAGLLSAGLAGADEPRPPAPDPFEAPPDPFAAPPDPFEAPPDPFAAPPDPFAAPPGVTAAQPGEPAAGFDAGAVALPRAPGVHLGPVELHGRANVTFSYTDGREPIELLDHAELELSSLDLYAEWFPRPWLGLQAEVELSRELEDEGRKLEVEPELLVAEVRPLADERLRLRAGVFPVPFGLERRFYAPSRNPLASRPVAFRRVVPGTYVDAGAMAWGRLPTGVLEGELELELGLVRGVRGPLLEDEPGTWDDDPGSEPQVVGRLGWTVIDLDPRRDPPGLAAGLPERLTLALGASGLWGHHDRDGRREVTWLGLDAQASFGGLELRGEWVETRYERAGRTGPLLGRGLYLQALCRRYFELPGLEQAWFAYRYDRARLPVSGSGVVERHHWGLGWVPHDGLTVKLGLERLRADRDWVLTSFLEVGYAF